MMKNGHSGLCSTCEGRIECTYPRYEDRPRIFCDEFDWAWQHRMEMTAASEKPQRAVASQSAQQPRTQSKYKGLCATCDNQLTCAFPRPADGVWRCEEFA